MLDKNASRIVKMLDEGDLVLDAGGWAYPFNRANFIVDIHPYETRGFSGSQGGGREYFSQGTWITHDVSSKKGLPFDDKRFDFVICSQTLEDIRDPLFLCSELMRIGKRGYIEVPSEVAELTRGIANDAYCGYYHHRWLVNIQGNQVRFRFKPHFIHTCWRFHFPKRFLKNLPEEKRVSYLFWDGTFDCAEVIQISRDKVEKYIEGIVRKERIYSDLSYFFGNLETRARALAIKLRLKLHPSSYAHKYMDTGEYLSR